MKTITQQSSKSFLKAWITQMPESVVKLLAIWLGTVVVFLPTFSNGFQFEWDDQWMLLNHELVLNPSWDNIKYYLTHYVDGQYFPLNQLHYIILFQINGFDPFIYHCGSLVLHLINIGLVYMLVQTVLIRLAPTLYKSWLVVLVTIMFAIHPLQVEAVAWISASKVLLFAQFTLGALLLYLKYLASGRHLYLVGVAMCYFLGFMTKEQMIILPMLLVLFDMFFRLDLIPLKRLALEKIPFFLIALVLWYYAAKSGMGALDPEAYPWYQRIALGSYCYFTYWFRFFAPVGLLHFYDYPVEVGEALPGLYYMYFLMMLLLCYSMMECWRSGSRLVLFCLLFTIVNLALVLHIVPSPRTYMAADRFVYLPMIGMALSFGWALQKATALMPRWKGSFVFGILTIVLVLFCVVSYAKTELWRDSLTLKKEIKEYLEMKNVLAK